MNFFRKELVDTFFYTDLNQNREDSKEVVINGRTYIKLGTRTATTVVANLYKVWDPSVKFYKYVALVGVTRQHPCDVKVDKEKGIELANEAANINPSMTITFDHKITYHEFKNFALSYISSLEPKFIKTRQEIVAEGGEEDLKNKKYSR